MPVAEVARRSLARSGPRRYAPAPMADAHEPREPEEAPAEADAASVEEPRASEKLADEAAEAAVQSDGAEGEQSGEEGDAEARDPDDDDERDAGAADEPLEAEPGSDDDAKPLSATSDEPAPERPRQSKARSKKRRRKRGADADVPVARDAKKGAASAPLPGAGTPDGNLLRRAFRAFDVGDYALVRAELPALEKAEDAAIRDAAADLKQRISIDPVQVVVILACALVLATIVYVWVF